MNNMVLDIQKKKVYKVFSIIFDIAIYRENLRGVNMLSTLRFDVTPDYMKTVRRLLLEDVTLK